MQPISSDHKPDLKPERFKFSRQLVLLFRPKEGVSHRGKSRYLNPKWLDQKKLKPEETENRNQDYLLKDH